MKIDARVRAALSNLPEEERRRRELLIKQYTDPDFLLAPWLDKHVQSQDTLRDGFVPIGSDLRDFSIIRQDHTWHVFYTDLRPGKSSRRPDNIHFVGHASSDDLHQWRIHSPALFIAPGTWEGAHIWAPYVFAIDSNPRLNRISGIDVRYVMMYTGLTQSLTQSIGMAFSSDLQHWVKYDGNPLMQPAHLPWACWSRTRLANCRDPHVMEDKDRYLMYYTAMTADAQACVAVAESDDLENWIDRGIALVQPIASASPGLTESACVHTHNGRYVLFYSYNGCTRYCFSQDPLAFKPGDSPVLIEDYWGLEVMEQSGDNWLVALFRRAAAGRVGALFFGVIVWVDNTPRIKLLSDAVQLSLWKNNGT